MTERGALDQNEMDGAGSSSTSTNSGAGAKPKRRREGLGRLTGAPAGVGDAGKRLRRLSAVDRYKWQLQGWLLASARSSRRVLDWSGSATLLLPSWQQVLLSTVAVGGVV